MNEVSQITHLLRQEEGVRYNAYFDSLAWPTIGVGFRLGPQGTPLKYYDFTLDDQTIDAWLQANIEAIQNDMLRCSPVALALSHCNQVRKDILTSMAYQMGCHGLNGFNNMLSAIADEDWESAAEHMLNSRWAKQTSQRALRHASVMKSGQWEPVYPFDI